MANPQLADNFKVPYTIIETDADGNPASAAPGDVCSVVSSDLDMATVVPDATPSTGTAASGWILGGKKLGSVSVTASVVRADGTAGPGPVTDVIDIVAGQPTTLAFGLGAPVPQTASTATPTPPAPTPAAP